VATSVDSGRSNWVIATPSTRLQSELLTATLKTDPTNSASGSVADHWAKLKAFYRYVILRSDVIAGWWTVKKTAELLSLESSGDYCTTGVRLSLLVHPERMEETTSSRYRSSSAATRESQQRIKGIASPPQVTTEGFGRNRRNTKVRRRQQFMRVKQVAILAM